MVLPQLKLEVLLLTLFRPATRPPEKHPIFCCQMTNSCQKVSQVRLLCTSIVYVAALWLWVMTLLCNLLGYPSVSVS